MPKIICIGEILGDFVPEGKGHILRPGGAPSNVAVNLARWGADAAIISKVGDDFLGRFLTDFVKSNNVDVSCVYKIKGYKTGLVFVFLDKSGERDFTFYGNPSADTMLMPSEVKESFIKKCSILHFGSISTMYKNNGAATLKGVKLAKKYGKIVSYDPNVRLNLWEGKHNAAKKHIKRYFKYADIIKISDTELKFLFGRTPDKKSIKGVFGKNQLVFISAGKNGCYVKLGDVFFHSPGVKVKAVDTTGAGDAFMAGVLYMVDKMGKGLCLDEKQLRQIASFANTKGAKAVMKKGAV